MQDNFCQDVDLNSLLVLYRDPVPILNTPARNYRIGSLDPNIRQVQYRTVEEPAWSIGQALAAMEEPDRRLTS